MDRAPKTVEEVEALIRGAGATGLEAQLIRNWYEQHAEGVPQATRERLRFQRSMREREFDMRLEKIQAETRAHDAKAKRAKERSDAIGSALGALVLLLSLAVCAALMIYFYKSVY